MVNFVNALGANFQQELMQKQKELSDISKELTQLAFVESVNAEQGKLEGFDCPICKNKGYILKLDSKGRRITSDCVCLKPRYAKRLIDKSGLGDSLSDCAFENWNAEEEFQHKMYNMAQDFLENLDGWFMLSGSAGIGKTFICTAICSELLNRCIPVLYVPWRTISRQAKAYINDAEQYEKLIRPIFDTKAIYIDDFLRTSAKRPTDADLGLAFEIINYRYVNKDKITIISSNFSLQEIAEFDNTVSSRIYHKAKEHYLDLGIQKNWRLRKGE